MTLESKDEDDHQADLPDERWSPERELERKELRNAVQKGLLTLSPEHRQVLLLRETEGLSYQEIGQALELDIGTVKSRISRGRKSCEVFCWRGGTFLRRLRLKRQERRAVHEIL